MNGGNTVFGQSGLTNKVLTANGGASPALSTATGAAGGTGSSNAVHFDGGKGAMSGHNSNYLFMANDNGGPFFLQNKGQATGASYTTGAAANAQSTGLSIATVVSSAPLDNNVSVSDSAGNQYDFVVKADLPSSAKDTSVFIARIGSPVTTATTLTVNNNGVSVTLTVTWFGTVQYADVDTGTVVTGSGTSTAPGVTVNNADTGAHKGYFTVLVNDSTTDVSAAIPSPASYITPDGATSSKYSAGTVYMHHFVKELPGSGVVNSFAATYGSSVPWSAVSIGLVPQDVAEPTLLKAGVSNTTGTTSPVAFTNAFAVPADRGYMLMLAQFAGTPGTISFTDATGNTWTQLSTVTIGSSVFRAYTAPAVTAYTTASTVTMNDTTSQAHCCTLYYVHEANGIDAALTKTATGMSSSPAITTNAGTYTGDLQMVIFANASTVDPTAGPSGFVSWGVNSSGALHSSLYAVRVPARTTYAASGTYAGSQAWGAMAFGFTNKVYCGSGGSSGGPLGPGNDGTDSGGSAWEGGCKGANALVSATGSGVAAAVPGGGGGGAASSDTSSLVGGSGATGMVRLTWTPPLKTFNDLVLHRPGAGANRSLCPVVTIPPNDPPDNREYAVPSLVSGHNAEFRGTYSVLLVANAWNSATTGVSRRVSVTVNQYEYKGGPAASVQATRVLTPADDIVNGYVDMGPLTLPVKDYDESDDEVYYTVSVHDTDTGDSFQDILFLDTTGQTVLVNIAPGTIADNLYSSYFIDEPTYERALGQVLGSGHGRERAVSVLDMTQLSGGPLYVDSGENLLLAYSTGGAPNLGITYAPRWYTDRIK